MKSNQIVLASRPQRNSTEIPMGPRVFPKLLTKSALVQGFIIGNYSERFGEALAYLTQWLNEGKMKYTETIIQGFNKLPDAFIALFSGKNLGKMLVETE